MITNCSRLLKPLTPGCHRWSCAALGSASNPWLWQESWEACQCKTEGRGISNQWPNYVPIFLKPFNCGLIGHNPVAEIGHPRPECDGGAVADFLRYGIFVAEARNPSWSRQVTGWSPEDVAAWAPWLPKSQGAQFWYIFKFNMFFYKKPCTFGHLQNRLENAVEFKFRCTKPSISNIGKFLGCWI